MCNTPGLGGASQQAAGESSALRAPGTPSQDLAQRIFLNTLYGAGKATGIGATGREVGGVLGALQARTALPSTLPAYTTPTLTATGLLSEQEAGLRAPFQQAIEQALGRTSSNYAMRGFNRPENIQAIAGSAAQNVAPQFANLYANLAAQNVGQRTQAPLIQGQQQLLQEEMTRQRFADLLAALGINLNALSGGSQVSGGVTQSNWLGGAAQGASQGAGQAGGAAALKAAGLVG